MFDAVDAGSRCRPSPTRSSSPTTSAARSAASGPSSVDRLEVQRGAITALIGPNGAGKTTFFNLLTGFDKPDTGTVDVRRRGRQRSAVATSSPAKGMVRTFQLTKVLARMTVLDNMMLAGQKQSGESMFTGLVRDVGRSGASDPSVRRSRSSTSST